MAREFAVLGLGRFGTGVALALTRTGNTVVGIDHDREVVQDLAEQLSEIAVGDASDENTLRLMGLQDFDVVIVAIGDFESNLLATVALKHLGVRYVVAKALTTRQAEILQRIGADEIVLPEQEAGERLAMRLTAPNVSQALMDETGISAGERTVPEAWIGKTLGDLDVRRKHDVLVIAIRRGAELLVAPGANDELKIEDHIMLVGAVEQLRRLGCRVRTHPA